jgi:hypothetical protein
MKMKQTPALDGQQKLSRTPDFHPFPLCQKGRELLRFSGLAHFPPPAISNQSVAVKQEGTSP